MTLVNMKIVYFGVEHGDNLKNDVHRSMQVVQLDKNIKLLDSPGVVMATNASDTAVILRNCVKVGNHLSCYIAICTVG